VKNHLWGFTTRESARCPPDLGRQPAPGATPARHSRAESCRCKSEPTGRLIAYRRHGSGPSLRCLLTGTEEAAKAIGVGVATLHRWQNHPEFQKAYRKANSQAVRQAVARLQQSTGAAASTVLKLMVDAKTPVAVKARLALSILDLASHLDGLSFRDALNYQVGGHAHLDGPPVLISHTVVFCYVCESPIPQTKPGPQPSYWLYAGDSPTEP
jgi:hypothetical protein